MAEPEVTVNWLKHQPKLCYFYPLRDCPGCRYFCARVRARLPADGEPLEAVIHGE